MTPDNVLNAIYEQLRPLVVELARYNVKGETLTVNFEVGTVTFEFK